GLFPAHAGDRLDYRAPEVRDDPRCRDRHLGRCLARRLLAVRGPGPFSGAALPVGQPDLQFDEALPELRAAFEFGSAGGGTQEQLPPQPFSAEAFPHLPFSQAPFAHPPQELALSYFQSRGIALIAEIA